MKNLNARTKLVPVRNELHLPPVISVDIGDPLGGLPETRRIPTGPEIEELAIVSMEMMGAGA